MSDKEKPEDNKVTPFSSIAGGKNKKETPSVKSGNARHQVYVSDAQFKTAMDLVRKDMNNALQLGNVANTQHYFLVKFLAQKGLIDEEEFNAFMRKELQELE